MKFNAATPPTRERGITFAAWSSFTPICTLVPMISSSATFKNLIFAEYGPQNHVRHATRSHPSPHAFSIPLPRHFYFYFLNFVSSNLSFLPGINV
ncbi:hypothetical protein BDZ91DRAFT_723973 [Kalaharituber pfeilii]|nr:hypothetical protein BDZ91DRAFT_723973 [Kalaharituber pfeilii]